MIRHRLLVKVFGLILCLSGCASWLETSNTLKPTPLKALTETQSLKTMWLAQIGDTGTGGFVPAYDNGNIVVADRTGTIQVLDALSGRVTSRHALARELVSGVSIVGDRVLVGTGDGMLLAVALATGKVVWEQTLTSVTLEPPVVVGDVVGVRTNDNRLTGFGVTEGTQLWSVGRMSPPLMVRDTGSMKAARDEALIVGMPAGKLVVVNPVSGSVMWESVVANPTGATELERVTDVVSYPAFNGNQICAVAYQGRVACFEAQSGNLQWTREISSSRGLVLDAKNVYVTSDDGTVSAFERSSGRNVWKQDDLKYRQVSGPALLGRYVLVSDALGYMHLLSNEDGNLVGRLQWARAGATGQPVSFGDFALVQNQNGRLAMVSLG